MAVTTQDGALQRLADQFRKDADARDMATANVLTEAWAGAYQETRREIDGLYAKVEAARAAGKPTSPAWAFQQARLSSLLNNTKAQLHRFGADASAAVRDRQAAEIQAAAAQAQRIAAAGAESAGMGLASGFLQTNAANITAAAGFLADGSPLAGLFAQLGDDAVADARRTITTGLSLGKHPDWIRRRFLQTMDLTASRAQTIARTEALRVYRQTTLDEFQASPAVGGWTWFAKLDNRTCPACVVMHNSEHGLDERLDGHPNCRCAMLPRTPSWEELLGPGAAGIGDTRPNLGPTGPEWFADQSPTVQRGMLGPAKFSAYSKGEISLADVVARPSNDRWGSMRRERSLTEIRKGRNANPPNRYPGDEGPAGTPPAPGPRPPMPPPAAPVPPPRPTPTEALPPLPRAAAPLGVNVPQVYAKKRKPSAAMPNRTVTDPPAVRAAWDQVATAEREWMDATAQSIRYRQALEVERGRYRDLYPDAAQRTKLARQDPRMADLTAKARRAVDIEESAWTTLETSRRKVVAAAQKPAAVTAPAPGVKPARADDLTLENTAAWTDEDFMEVMGESWDDPLLLARIEEIIEDRETKGVPVPPAPPAAVVDAAKTSPTVDPFTGKAYATTEARKPRKLSSKERLEEDHQNYVNASYMRAMDETNGVMLNELGRRQGVSDLQLFMSNAATARKYASEELVQYWEKHGRHSKASFDYMMNETPSSRAAFEATRRAGFGGPSGRDKDRA